MAFGNYNSVEEVKYVLLLWVDEDNVSVEPLSSIKSMVSMETLKNREYMYDAIYTQGKNSKKKQPKIYQAKCLCYGGNLLELRQEEINFSEERAAKVLAEQEEKKKEKASAANKKKKNVNTEAAATSNSKKQSKDANTELKEEKKRQQQAALQASKMMAQKMIGNTFSPTNTYAHPIADSSVTHIQTSHSQGQTNAPLTHIQTSHSQGPTNAPLTHTQTSHSQGPTNAPLAHIQTSHSQGPTNAPLAHIQTPHSQGETIANAPGPYIQTSHSQDQTNAPVTHIQTPHCQTNAPLAHIQTPHSQSQTNTPLTHIQTCTPVAHIQLPYSQANTSITQSQTNMPLLHSPTNIPDAYNQTYSLGNIANFNSPRHTQTSTPINNILDSIHTAHDTLYNVDISDLDYQEPVDHTQCNNKIQQLEDRIQFLENALMKPFLEKLCNRLSLSPVARKLQIAQSPAASTVTPTSIADGIVGAHSSESTSDDHTVSSIAKNMVTNPENADVELVPGYGVKIGVSQLDICLRKAKNSPTALVRHLLTVYFTDCMLAKSSARGSKEKEGLDNTIINAIIKYVMENSTKSITEKEIVQAINCKCADVRAHMHKKPKAGK